MVLYSLYLKTLVAPRSYPCIIFIQFKVIQVCSLYSTQPFLFGSSGSRPMHQVTIRGSCTQNIFYFTLMLKMHKGKKTKFICPCLACLPIEVPKTHRYVGSKAPPLPPKLLYSTHLQPVARSRQHCYPVGSFVLDQSRTCTRLMVM